MDVADALLACRSTVRHRDDRWHLVEIAALLGVCNGEPTSSLASKPLSPLSECHGETHSLVEAFRPPRNQLDQRIERCKNSAHVETDALKSGDDWPVARKTH